jgi:DNA invertase Pin-like site-specific DNA recombinase
MDAAERENGLTKSTPRPIVRAAQYVRMSTEHQKYSTENQAAVIAQYAAARGITIVRTYADDGKSGLRLDGRDALKQLISDVNHRRADFNLILVYDISRWGRFQDPDESASYEFVCRKAGIPVQYCAEQIENDGSLTSNVIKSMKRVMAAEYSRELSVKVFAGQCRLIQLGFRQGGLAGYGLRRQLIDEHRTPKGELGRGQYKSLQTDRVVLVPGPNHEVETVRRMYRMFVCEGKNENDIATILNGEGSRTHVARPWSRGTVHEILTNEKYIGHNIYNRKSFKLKKKRITNSEDMWIRAADAFDAIVDSELFLAAQRRIDERSRRLSDDEMLEMLRGLLAERGYLSGLIIDERETMPSSSAYRSRFGSLLAAYHLIGYSRGRDYRYIEINRMLRDMYPHVISEVIAAIQRLGGAVHSDPASDLLTINNEFTASIVIVRCLTTATGLLRWKIRLDTGLCPDITVALRMDPANAQVRDYYLLPRIGMSMTNLRLSEENGTFLDAYRFESLDFFFHLTTRSNIRGAA